MHQMCESPDLADDPASPRKFNNMAHPVQVRSHATDKT